MKSAANNLVGPTQGPPPTIRLVNVHKSFDAHHVLRGVSLDFLPGRTNVVLGPSGCGKSVMLKHLVGLLRPDAGQVWFDDERIDTLSERRLGPLRRQIGFLFQQSALFDSMNVEANVAYPLLQHTRMRRKERRRRVREVLKMVGMGGALKKMPAELSGGQRKRVALARAIVLNPRVLLYDEPTTGLDPIRSDSINDLIIMLQRTLGITSIVVTHDLASAFRIGHRLTLLHKGSVLADGTAERLRASDDPIVKRFLNGTARNNEAARDAHDQPTIEIPEITVRTGTVEAPRQ